jgi:hypothetical protein
MVTEPGGTIAEHRRIMRHQGRVWWGWWFRQSERVPRVTLTDLFESYDSVPVVLLDSGSLSLYRAEASEIVVAPTSAGLHSPDYDLTPEYYVRAQYPLWFMLRGDIVPLEVERLDVVARPTESEAGDSVPAPSTPGTATSLEELRDDRPTLWVVTDPQASAHIQV